MFFIWSHVLNCFYSLLDGSWSDFPDPEDVPPLSKHLAKYSPPKVSQSIQASTQANLHSLAVLPSSPPSNNTHQSSAHHSVQTQMNSDYLRCQQNNYPSIQASLISGSQNTSQYGTHNESYNSAVNGNCNQTHNGSHNVTSSKSHNTSSKPHGSVKTQSNSHHGTHQSGRTNMDHEYHEISDEEEVASLEVSA